jgi:hypothetical protein
MAFNEMTGQDEPDWFDQQPPPPAATTPPPAATTTPPAATTTGASSTAGPWPAPSVTAGPSGTNVSTVTQPSQAQWDANPRDAMITRDQQQWYNRLRAKAIALRFADPDKAASEELQGVINAASYAQNAGVDPERYVAAAEQRLVARGANNNGPAGQSDTLSGVNGGGGAASGGPNGQAGGGQGGQSGVGGSGQSSSWWRPFTEQFSAPQRPAEIDAQWNQPFTAPTQEQAQQDPGFQFTLDQGLQAIQRSAAARGTALNPGTMKALNDYAQGAASTQYGNVYNRAANTYGMNYDTFGRERSNLASTYNDTYNRAMQEYMGRYGIDTGNQQNALGAQGQQFNQGLARDQFGLQAQGQYFNQGLARDQFGLARDQFGLQTNELAFNQGLAGQQFGLQNSLANFNMANTTSQNAFNNYYNLANLGLTAAQIQGGAGNGLSDYFTQLGNANASGTVGATNPWLSWLSDTANQASLADVLTRSGYGKGKQ